MKNWIDFSKERPKEEPWNAYTVGDTIRMKNYQTAGGYRVWAISGCHLGATRQESTYGLMPLDVSENKPIHVPCIMLESHPAIERIGYNTNQCIQPKQSDIEFEKTWKNCPWDSECSAHEIGKFIWEAAMKHKEGK